MLLACSSLLAMTSFFFSVADSLSVSITTSCEPTGTLSPTAPWIDTTVPEAGAGISTIALSVSTSTRG
jgi:hypothetical protein